MGSVKGLVMLHLKRLVLIISIACVENLMLIKHICNVLLNIILFLSNLEQAIGQYNT